MNLLVSWVCSLVREVHPVVYLSPVETDKRVNEIGTEK